MESVSPSPSRSHANVSGLSSGSRLPSLENVTASGSGPSVLSAVARAIGGRVPLMYSIR